MSEPPGLHKLNANMITGKAVQPRSAHTIFFSFKKFHRNAARPTQKYCSRTEQSARFVLSTLVSIMVTTQLQAPQHISLRGTLFDVAIQARIALKPLIIGSATIARPYEYL